MKLPYTQHFPDGGLSPRNFNDYMQYNPILVPGKATLTVFYSEDGMVSHFTVAHPTTKTPAGQFTPSVIDFVEQP